MALINKDAALREALRIIEKCREDSGVELLSYKRNRTVALIRRAGSAVSVRENGYLVEECTVCLQELPKLLKSCIHREFPRSRKIRLYKISDPEDLERTRQKI